MANYLKRTRAANKVNVTFDYETGAFVPVEDGEFVVVTNHGSGDRSAARGEVLLRSVTFTSSIRTTITARIRTPAKCRSFSRRLCRVYGKWLDT